MLHLDHCRRLLTGLVYSFASLSLFCKQHADSILCSKPSSTTVSLYHCTPTKASLLLLKLTRQLLSEGLAPLVFPGDHVALLITSFKFLLKSHIFRMVDLGYPTWNSHPPSPLSIILFIFSSWFLLTPNRRNILFISLHGIVSSLKQGLWDNEHFKGPVLSFHSSLCPEFPSLPDWPLLHSVQGTFPL